MGQKMFNRYSAINPASVSFHLLAVIGLLATTRTYDAAVGPDPWTASLAGCAFVCAVVSWLAMHSHPQVSYDDYFKENIESYCFMLMGSLIFWWTLLYWLSEWLPASDWKWTVVAGIVSVIFTSIRLLMAVYTTHALDRAATLQFAKRKAAKDREKRKEQMEEERRQLAIDEELKRRPEISAAAKREVLAVHAKHSALLSDSLPFSEFRETLDTYLGTSKHSNTIARNKAILVDKVAKTVIRQTIRQLYSENAEILRDCYLPDMLDEDLETLLLDTEPLAKFQASAQTLTDSLTQMIAQHTASYKIRMEAERVREEALKAKVDAEQKAAEVRRQEAERLLQEAETAKRQAILDEERRKREEVMRSEIRTAVLRDAQGSGLSSDEIEQEIELRLLRWSTTNK